jgi:hypothetical protein
MGDSGQGAANGLADGALPVRDDTRDRYLQRIRDFPQQRHEILFGAAQQASRQKHLPREALAHHPQNLVADIGLQAIHGQ